MSKKRIMIVLGTRPEAIKLAPVVLALKDSEWATPIVCNTGQHREMSAQVLSLFGIEPDVDLDIMHSDQTLSSVTTAILTRMEAPLTQHCPDWVIVQGDTTTTFAAALSAYYKRTPVAHIEAGLRTGNIYAPWPEEMNRRLVSEIAVLHFPPTQSAYDNLIREGVLADRITVTGNTGIDALKTLARRLVEDGVLREKAERLLVDAGVPMDPRPLVLITGHRRENFGKGFESICSAIATLAQRYPEHAFVYPVHPNPRVRETVLQALGGAALGNVYMVPPLDYLPFVQLLSRATLILTDSGGVQEEAPSLGKRVVVLREVTERSEGVGTGVVRLAGVDADKIIQFATEALDGVWPSPADGCDLYGDGAAAFRILDALRESSSQEVAQG